ncbi:MAG: hypothetical protein EON89_00490 [Brevundimonas sp.]|nr:MAG: hypothetical protein EON89_00490 [Brevundimonas sp.]
MLLTAFMALALWQDPATAQSTVAPANTAPVTAEQARVAQQRRHEGAVVCQNRAPTGSVMNRRMCRTERSVRADAARARNYVGEVTRGSVHEPHPDIGVQ